MPIPPAACALEYGNGKEGGRLSTAQSRSSGTCIHVLVFALPVSDANEHEPKAKKKFCPLSHVVSPTVVGVEAVETALVQREKHSSASASPLLASTSPSQELRGAVTVTGRF